MDTDLEMKKGGKVTEMKEELENRESESQIEGTRGRNLKELKRMNKMISALVFQLKLICAERCCSLCVSAL